MDEINGGSKLVSIVNKVCEYFECVIENYVGMFWVEFVCCELEINFGWEWVEEYIVFLELVLWCIGNFNFNFNLNCLVCNLCEE